MSNSQGEPCVLVCVGNMHLACCGCRQVPLHGRTWLVRGRSYAARELYLSTHGGHACVVCAGIHALEKAGLRAALMDAVLAATQRAEELSAPTTAQQS